LALQERRKEIFLNSKSHARDKKGALQHLHETLRNMKTDYLDLWQIHDVRTEEDMQEIFDSQGALAAFIEARAKGLVRFIGVTGHHDPEILKRCMEQFNFDTVLLPINPAEPHYLSFIETVLPLARKKNMGIIAMKVYWRGFAAKIPRVSSLEPFLRFALSQPISTAVIGCDNIRQLEDNVRFATSFKPMTFKEKEALVTSVAPYARRLLYYKP
jgi:predicted aldo/keto reductase-like oxidoreductase